MKRYPAISAAAVATILALAGWGSDTPPQGREAETSPPGAAAQTAAASAGHNRADTMFLSQMIPHHQRAIQVSELMLAKKDIDPQIKQPAEDMKAAQAKEVEQMKSWLEAWDEPGTLPSGGPTMDDMAGEAGSEGERDAGQPGEDEGSDTGVKMTAQQFNQLKEAEGIVAERLFLTGMSRHHEGSIAMAEQVTSEGANPEVIALAEKIMTEQRAEVEKMKELVGKL
ncbi:DUF305 domain-containing protein [Arthrobacter deserti]|uniref:DUF305 domain-containing protein n=1 Tax=Arthrobacter deserti TaxID=1742687 RepID=A0ABX1JLK4_9MICC|nr:DUF305 domain-containing protein [Arthrobacter deserti]